MAWVFDIDTGEFSRNGKVFCHSERFNLPVGTYLIGYVRTHPDLGEVVMMVYREMMEVVQDEGIICGEPCIVGHYLNLPRIVRLRIATSEDRVLEVVQD
ncbi:MAG: hypothetical protein D0531_05445 [Methylococcales bacterium]|nr:MAG: hypothetical protein D0531_05445 [Methylococcales bacterium]